MGTKNLLWLYTQAHLQDAWEMLPKALAEAWEIAGADCTKFMQKIRAGYEASASFRSEKVATEVVHIFLWLLLLPMMCGKTCCHLLISVA